MILRRRSGGARQLVFFVVGLSLGACERQPAFGDQSLTCSAEAPDCPEITDESGATIALRCFESLGLCGINSPPRIDGTPASTLTLDGTQTLIQLQAQASDPDGDTVVLRWQQTGGPETLLLEAVETAIDAGPTMNEEEGLRTGLFGRFDFQVTPLDNLGLAGSPARVEVFVEPTGSAIYLSSGGKDDEDCGTFDRPCQSPEQALLQASNKGLNRVLVGAHPAGEPYAHCLAVAGLTIEGCYEPDTWIPSSRGRSACTFSCDVASGHQLGSETHLEGLTLESTSDAGDESLFEELELPPSGTQDLAFTVFTGGGAISLENVALLAPACGAECVAVGLVNVAADVALQDFDIRGTIDGFEPLQTLIGIVHFGGSLVITPGELDFALISSNVPVTDRSVGISVLNDGQLIAQGLRIEGGFAPTMRGIELIGASADLNNIEIDIRGFGSNELTGISSQPCPIGDSDCTTNTGTGGGASHVLSALSVQNSVITIESSSANVGAVPCVGASVVLDGTHHQIDVIDNQLQVSSNFGLAAGLYYLNATTTNLGFNATEIRGNSISIGAARLDPVCLDTVLEDGDLQAGSIGVAMDRVEEVRLSNNAVDVQASEGPGFGFYISAGDQLDITNNDVRMHGEGIDGLEVIVAAVTLVDAPDDPINGGDVTTPLMGNQLTRNALYGDATVSDTFGLLLQNDSPQISWPWLVANNFIHGGLGRHSRGLVVLNRERDPELFFAHNSIDAGGSSSSATSYAVETYRLSAFVNSPIDLGNNLLSAGNARGRRMLIENNYQFNSDTRLPDLSGNIGQYPVDPAEPFPIEVLPVTALAGEDLESEEFGREWFSLDRHTGLYSQWRAEDFDPVRVYESDSERLPRSVGTIDFSDAKAVELGDLVSYEVGAFANGHLLAGRLDYDFGRAAFNLTASDPLWEILPEAGAPDFVPSDLALLTDLLSRIFVLPFTSGGVPDIRVIEQSIFGGADIREIDLFLRNSNEDQDREFDEFFDAWQSAPDNGTPVVVDAAAIDTNDTEAQQIGTLAVGHHVYVFNVDPELEPGGAVLDYETLSMRNQDDVVEDHTIQAITDLKVFPAHERALGSEGVAGLVGEFPNWIQPVVGFLAQSELDAVSRVRPYFLLSVDPFDDPAGHGQGINFYRTNPGDSTCEGEDVTAFEWLNGNTELSDPLDFTPSDYGLPGGSLPSHLVAVLGCADGVVEVYWVVLLNALALPGGTEQERLFLHRVARIDAGLSKGVHTVHGTLGINNAMRISATFVDENGFLLADVPGHESGSPLGPIDSQWIDRVGDVAMRDATNILNFGADTLVIDTSSYSTEIDALHNSITDYAPVCPFAGLQFDEDDELIGVDFHLDTSGANACVDTGLALSTGEPLAGDFDAEDSRTDTLPDVGADEISP